MRSIAPARARSASLPRRRRRRGRARHASRSSGAGTATRPAQRQVARPTGHLLREPRHLAFNDGEVDRAGQARARRAGVLRVGAAGRWGPWAAAAGATSYSARSPRRGARRRGAASPPRFAPPAPVTALSDPASIDEDPTFTGDLLELYFMSTRNGTKDIWTSRRAAAADPWGAPSLVAELSSAATDYAPAVASTACISGSPPIATWRAAASGSRRARAAPIPGRRPRRSASWRAAASTSRPPSTHADDAVLLLEPRPSGRDGRRRRGYDIYWPRAPAPPTAWGSPAAVAGRSTAPPTNTTRSRARRAGAVLHVDALRHGDIYWTARPSLSDPFPPPVLLTISIPRLRFGFDAVVGPDVHDVLVDALGERGDLRDPRAAVGASRPRLDAHDVARQNKVSSSVIDSRRGSRNLSSVINFRSPPYPGSPMSKPAYLLPLSCRHPLGLRPERRHRRHRRRAAARRPGASSATGGDTGEWRQREAAGRERAEA